MGGKGGSGGIADRLFETPENPFGWTLRMFRFRGIDTRIHLFTLVYFGVEILSAMPRTNAGWIFTIGTMASLFIIVLLHEFGHAFACRAVGGESNRIVLLPFGGLAFTLPPHEWRAQFITTFCGPLVNVGLALVTSVALFAIGRSDSILFNPLHPWNSVPAAQIGQTQSDILPVLLLWQFHVVNFIIFAFNVFLPFFPLDGGRMVQELLWSRMGYERSMRIAVNIGLVGAGAVTILGITAGQTTLMMIGIFGVWVCWMERQRLRFAAGPVMDISGLAASGAAGPAPMRPAGPSRAELKRREREETDAAEVDRILAKIATQGMQSLTRSERSTLERVRKKKSTTG